jgi:ATP-dependent Clp protease ATP-binding subunit ClpC
MKIEKAHPDVYNILLQLMDDGSLTDSFGRKVDFRNTVVIMTSNVGTKQIKNDKSVGFDSEKADDDYESMKKKVTGELKKLFNPELLNRIDSTIIFRALNIDDIKQIVDIEIASVAKRLAERGISFTLTNEARTFWRPTVSSRCSARGRSNGRFKNIWKTRWPRNFCAASMPATAI